MCAEVVMDLTSSSAEETRFSDTGSVCPSSSARQSPKVQTCVPTSLTASSTAAAHQQLPSPVVPRKICSKNSNGTIVTTTIPSNDAELQLYRVMQRASLLAYYDTLLEMGGDDVQQLCDAGEEEFLEIMALVGMASKPLHVRRFQKSLQEWMIDPSPFQVPLMPGNVTVSETIGFTNNSSIVQNTSHVVCSTKRSILDINRPVYSPSPGLNDSVNSIPAVTSPGYSISKSSSRSNSPLDVPSCSSSSGSGSLSVMLTPTLLESQINRLRSAAERISKHLPQFEPKTHNTKRKVCKELELVMAMGEDDLRRMEEIRKYAAIYGRFDCKRKPEKPLTLHEVSVNEAAAQICHFIPALLTRRDELFPLARQVVRDSGYLFSKGAIQWSRRRSEDDDGDHDDEPPAKKMNISDKKNA